MGLTCRSALIAACVAGASCASATSPNATSPSTTTTLALTRFRADATSYSLISGYDTAATLVIRDRPAWQSAWSQLYSQQYPVPALPDIDFTTEMVVLAATGSRPSSGYDVLFTAATESDGVVTIETALRSPGPGCITASIVTSPVDLARMPMRNGTVVFHSTSNLTTCR